MYTPHVVAVMVGQTLAIKNSDATMHNVMATPEENSPFNFGMPAKDQVINKVFKHPELRMKVKCFMHPWMVGYVHVLDNPFFAVTGEDGSFTIKGLPPGEYELTVLHESSALQAEPETAKLKVTAGGTQKVAFTYHLKSAK
jgi:plastocyanin